MARKSRWAQNDLPKVQKADVEILSTAIYARLSVENSGKAETVDVIANQVEICKSYLTQCPYLNLVDTYIDNGRTGTVFDRPEFNRLMDDIRNGKVRCLVVRDLSRFGRDYIETGTYLERIFPQIGLRFISIKENYDSFSAGDKNEDLIVPLQNMVNSLYSKDISRKVSTALRAQMEQGTFRKRNLPYGYKWNEDRSNMVIDPEAAQYVRQIFRWKLDGVSYQEICVRLTGMGVVNPELRKYQVGVRKGDCAGSSWGASTVYGILTNPHYVGDTVLGRSESAIYRGVKNHKINDSSDWIIYPNTHEAIISREVFDAVQTLHKTASSVRQENIRKNAGEHEKLIDLFDGRIVCADCGGRMYFHRKQMAKKGRPWFAFYECSTRVKRGGGNCSRHYLQSGKLEEQVLDAIQVQVQTALDYEKLLDKLRDSPADRSIRDRQNALISSLTLKRSSVFNKLTRLYEDFVEGVLNGEEYVFAKKTYDEQFDALSRQLDEAVLRRERFREAMSSDNKWITLMKSVSGTEVLTQELVDNTIEQVKVCESGGIELVMRYHDIYALMVQSVKEVQEVR